MNCTNENQHYVSRVLLSRFKRPGHPLHCFDVASGAWKERSERRACSATGYNQLIVNGQVENSFEECFSQVETHVPEILRLLQEAINSEVTLLDNQVYENLCRYCAMLKLASPAGKAGAAVSLTVQANFELERGDSALLRQMGFTNDEIQRLRTAVSLKQHIIIDADNLFQLAFRTYYSRTCDTQFWEFLNANWTICSSPIDLPISDIGLVPVVFHEAKLHFYLLPVGPRLVLEGIHHFDQAKNSREPRVKRHILNSERAELWHEIICHSAVKEVICHTRDSRVQQHMQTRGASRSGIQFQTITQPKLVTSSGTIESNGMFRISLVSREEYRKFVHSVISPNQNN